MRSKAASVAVCLAFVLTITIAVTAFASWRPAAAEISKGRFEAHPATGVDSRALWLVDTVSGEVTYLILEYKDGKNEFRKLAQTKP